MPVRNSDFALVIGIDHYPHYRPLSGAIADADEFENWVRDQTSGGGVPGAQCKKITSSAPPARPLGPEIDDALEEIVTKLAAQQPAPRRFYLFFSGHGLAQIEQDRAATAFCTARWSEVRRGDALDSDCYLNYVVQSGKFEEVVLFADCCRVRKVSAKGFCPTLANINPNPTASKVRRFLAYATELMNPAFEVATGGDTTPARGHFSRALMNALKGAAAQPGGGVRAGDLERYLYAEVPRIAREHNHNQQPEVISSYDPAEEPVFGSATRVGAGAPAANVIITFQTTAAGQVRLEGPDIDEFRFHNASPQPWPLPLGIGIYILRDMQSGREINIRVRSQTEVQNVVF